MFVIKSEERFEEDAVSVVLRTRQPPPPPLARRRSVVPHSDFTVELCAIKQLYIKLIDSMATRATLGDLGFGLQTTLYHGM